VKERKKLRLQPNHAIRVVALGGGTGLSVVLRGLKEHIADSPKDVLQSRTPEAARRPISDLTAVVAVSDDGGSSGRLRHEYRVLPPGDIRNCMVALSTDEPLLAHLFQYRFPTGRGLAGHSFGNLFLTALTNVTGDFLRAVEVSSQVLAIRGKILPSTEQNVTLEAELEDGSIIVGESKISRSRKRIVRIRLSPRRVRPSPQTLQAFRAADLILVGPGSLYTSIIPNLLVEGVAGAIAGSKATRVYIANLMTQPGETSHYSVADHVRAIYEHAGRRIFDYAIVNRSPIAPRLLRRYRAGGAEPVEPSLGALADMGLKCIEANVLQQDRVVRHDQSALANLLLRHFVNTGS
jgi:uncharacterized cofD-like protein